MSPLLIIVVILLALVMWRWVVALAIVMCVVFLVLGATDLHARMQGLDRAAGAVAPSSVRPTGSAG